MASQRRVVIIDADRAAAHALAERLGALGCECRVVTDAKRLERALDTLPDLVFLDLEPTSALEGRAVAHRLASRVPVVGCAEFPSRDDMVFAIRVGLADWLDKPVSREALTACLDRLTARFAPRPPGGGSTPSHPVAPQEGPETSAEPPSLNAVIQMVRGGTISLPEMPAVVTALRAVLQKPDVEPHEVVPVLEREPALVARVVAMANSAAFARRGPVRDVSGAVQRLGTRRVRSLVETSLLERTFPMHGPLGARLATLWERQVTGACIARALAARVGEPDVEEIYLLALFADVGELFLLGVLSHLSGSIDLQGPWIEVLREWHPNFGAALVRKWGLGPRFAMVARYHHTPTVEPEGAALRPLCLVHLAAELTERIAPTAQGPHPLRSVPACLDLLRLTEADLDALDLPAVRAEAIAAGG